MPGVLTTPVSSLVTLPPFASVATTETAYPYIANVANYLSGTDTVSSVTATLRLISTGASVTGWQVGSIVISGSQITIIMDISKLQKGQIYQLAVNFIAQPDIKQPTFITFIQVRI